MLEFTGIRNVESCIQQDLYTFRHDPDSIPNGCFSSGSKKGLGTFLNDRYEVEIEGQYFGFASG